MDLTLGVGSDVRQGRTRSSRCAGQQEIKPYPEIDSRVGNRWHGRIVGPAPRHGLALRNHSLPSLYRWLN